MTPGTKGEGDSQRGCTETGGKEEGALAKLLKCVGNQDPG